MVFLDFLKSQGYLQLQDPVWDPCLVIPREEFSFKMAMSLRIVGIRYHFTLLNNYGVVFVELEQLSVFEHKIQLVLLEVNY